MKSWVFSVQNYPDSRPSVENCPAGKSPSLPRSSRCQGRSPALAGAERQRSALTAESRGAVFTRCRAASSARNNRCNRPSAALTSALWIKPRSPFRAPHRSPVPASRAEPPGAWPPPPSVRTPARATAAPSARSTPGAAVVPWTTRPWPHPEQRGRRRRRRPLPRPHGRPLFGRSHRRTRRGRLLPVAP